MEQEPRHATRANLDVALTRGLALAANPFAEEQQHDFLRLHIREAVVVVHDLSNIAEVTIVRDVLRRRRRAIRVEVDAGRAQQTVDELNKGALDTNVTTTAGHAVAGRLGPQVKAKDWHNPQ